MQEFGYCTYGNISNFTEMQRQEVARIGNLKAFFFRNLLLFNGGDFSQMEIWLWTWFSIRPNNYTYSGEQHCVMYDRGPDTWKGHSGALSDFNCTCKKIFQKQQLINFQYRRAPQYARGQKQVNNNSYLKSNKKKCSLQLE